MSSNSEIAEVADPIRLALTWFMLGVAFIMTGFTGADLASGDQATSLWIGMAAWPVTAIISGYLIHREGKPGRMERDSR